MNRNGTTSEVISVGVFDDTADASLSLYGGLCDSASLLQPSQTILLIWNPGWRIDKSVKLFLNSNSRVDINPDMDEAYRLRALAHHLQKQEHVNPPFPDVDVTCFEEAPVRALYTLADVDGFARSNPGEKLIGYLSVVLTELNIVTPFKRNMLMSNECCGVAVFANSQHVICEQCEEVVNLRINPKIVRCICILLDFPPRLKPRSKNYSNETQLGSIIDETGHLSAAKVIFSDAAWEQLLGRTPEQLINTSLDVMQYLEQRLVFIRVTMGFAVSLENGIGRLGVWCVSN